MKYRITYETDKLPENVPDGATVEKVQILPLEIKGVGFNKTKVLSLDEEGILSITYDDGLSKDAFLPKDKAREFIDGLLEYVGEPSFDELKNPPDVKDRPIQVGDKVRATALINSTVVMPGSLGKVTKVDPSDPLLTYWVEFPTRERWVSAQEIARVR